ncbi:MAG: hypothetical protein ACK55I_39540, partial [bacterium]
GRALGHRPAVGEVHALRCDRLARGDASERGVRWVGDRELVGAHVIQDDEEDVRSARCSERVGGRRGGGGMCTQWCRVRWPGVRCGRSRAAEGDRQGRQGEHATAPP